jgi:4-hydroxy-3-methylbut-2-enyl diphosphate reductase
MNLILAQHHGMCFGVRDALRTTHTAAQHAPLTVLGQLVHNPLVDRHLAAVGAQRGDLDDLNSSSTQQVAITAHGASDKHRRAWQSAGHTVIDTTCPLVKKAHHALATLVSDGYQPVVIGQSQHVEVRGLIGDFPQAVVVLDECDLVQILRTQSSASSRRPRSLSKSRCVSSMPSNVFIALPKCVSSTPSVIPRSNGRPRWMI